MVEKILFASRPALGNGALDMAVICPHCLMSIVIAELSIKCPFCKSQHGGSSDDLLAAFGDPVAIFFSLFDKCQNCNRMIKYLECPHCQKAVDLFAPYDEEEIERRSYE